MIALGNSHVESICTHYSGERNGEEEDMNEEVEMESI